jgi:hypothetical protein
MERLFNLAKDKLTMTDLREYFKTTLEKKLVEKALLGQDVVGFKEANDIIKVALNELETMVKPKKGVNLNQSE